MAMLRGKQIAPGSIANDRLVTPVNVPSRDNKDMAASTTATDFDEACSTAIITTPSSDGTVSVFVNGLRETLGDGVKTKSCYFSGDAGATARAISAITALDKLYWVGSVAGYQLSSSTDRIDFEYSIPAP